MEVKIHGNSTLMNICYPYMMISNIVSTPEVQEKILFGAKEPSPDETELVKHNLINTPINLKSVLGKGNISVGEFINLKSGDVIRLEQRTDQSLPLYANNKKMFDSIVGINKKRYAVRILSHVPEEKKYVE
jgi:flagellar motor switch protein FliM